MCDKIRVRIIDRDAGLGSINKDDIVGTGYIPLSQISVPGEGGKKKEKRRIFYLLFF